MRIAAPFFVLAAASLALPGCIARTAAAVVTAPVKVGSKAVDLATTSQSEADEKRGREMRKREERLGKLEREYAETRDRCEAGYRESCEELPAMYREIEELRDSLPAPPLED